MDFDSGRTHLVTKSQRNESAMDLNLDLKLAPHLLGLEHILLRLSVTIGFPIIRRGSGHTTSSVL